MPGPGAFPIHEAPGPPLDDPTSREQRLPGASSGGHKGSHEIVSERTVAAMTSVRYVSTKGSTPETSLRDALFGGLARDGGLYMPATLPQLSPEDRSFLQGQEWPAAASYLARRFLDGEMDAGETESLVKSALDFPLPMVRLTRRIVLLDLSQGPTLAFKDVGARFMARLMAHLRRDEPQPLTILTATSGDTGGAVAHAFLGLPEVRVVILFPDGQVSTRQERQFSTLGRNVQAVAVQGDFDDCQRMAKDAFRDRPLRANLSLSSANSINIGRFLPQSFYFVHAWGRVRSGIEELRNGTLPPDQEGPPKSPAPPPVLFSVPSGNFGNLAAGLMAKAMGLPDVSFLAATNANDSVPRYLRTGRFRPRPSLRTLSTAMDVGNPSNLARILHLYHRDLNRLRFDLKGRRVSDPETRGTIRRVHEEWGRVLDPHTAVGFLALERELRERPGTAGVLLATASPAKFAEVVEPILGTSLPIPDALARGLEGERRVTPMAPDTSALKEFLTSGG
jgi:threonine synthase